MMLDGKSMKVILLDKKH